jgi:hypothetical protein
VAGEEARTMTIENETQPLSAEELAEVEARASATPSGSWTYDSDEETVTSNGCTIAFVGAADRGALANTTAPLVGRYIAHARIDIPRLLATVRARDARILQLETAVRELAATNDLLRSALVAAGITTVRVTQRI